MPLFRRRPDPPAWASYLDADQWHAFSELVRYEADRRHWSHDLEQGAVGDGSTPMGLTNIAQTCNLAPRDEWTVLVAEHFAVLEQIATGPVPHFKDPGEARAALKARLLNDDFVPDAGFELAERRVAEGLRLVLAYDLPDYVKLPPRNEVLEWGEEDELFEIALAQTRAEPGNLERHDFDEIQGGPTAVWTFDGDSFFTATHALWGAGLDGAHGVLVAVPTRHIVVAHPINDVGVFGAVGAMINMTHGLWTEGPGSLSNELYLLDDGTLERQPTELRADNVVFTPTAGFTEIMNRLAEPEPGPGDDAPGPG
jgi:hypothetical protein